MPHGLNLFKIITCLFSLVHYSIYASSGTSFHSLFPFHTLFSQMRAKGLIAQELQFENIKHFTVCTVKLKILLR